MAQATFTIASGADNQRWSRSGPAYPPAGTITDEVGFGCNRQMGGGPSYYISVALLRWDTSTLGVAATVTAATLRVVPSGVYNGESVRSVVAEFYTWTDVAADYTDTAPASPAGSTALSSYTANTAGDMTLSGYATGVSKSGTTYLRLQISGGEPVATNAMDIHAYGNGSFNPPQLIVDYTPGATTRLAPDAILAQTNLTGAVSAIQDDPDSETGTWLTAP